VTVFPEVENLRAAHALLYCTLLGKTLADQTRLPKVPIDIFGWIAKKTKSGILSVATRRVTTEKLPVLDFRKAPKRQL